jgi:hypothetical protein
MTAIPAETKPEAPIAQEKIEEKVIQQPVEAKVEQDDGVDPNWKAFREARKKDRADKEAAERRAAEKEAEAEALKRAMEAAFARGQPQAQASGGYGDSYDTQETEDQRIARMVEEQIAKRDAILERQRMENEQREYPNRLARDFGDFNQVCSPENLDYLEFHHKEIARPLQRLQDGYDKWADIYHAVKKYVPNSTTARREAQKAETNLQKPKSMSSTAGMAPGEQVGSARLTEEKQAANWARMQKLLKSVG